ncbi:MAG TPA: hypothetical protein VGC29_02455 [Flavisolibacter sp.]
MHKRNINVKLRILRLTLAVALPLCIWAFRSGLSNLGYFLSVMLIFGAFINIVGLSISQNSIHITRYFLYGFIPVNWTFRKELIANARLFQEVETEYLTGATNWWDLFAIFFPLRFNLQRLNLKYKRKNGSEGFVKLNLSKEEYKLISQLFKTETAITSN